MKCPRCDGIVKDNLNRCNICGQDLSVVRHLCRISNAYYNIGLEQAIVRNLSGAIATLRRSLEFNKHNTNARNLLGLVLNEMGETASALSEWVISKYLQQGANDADRYINMIQKNPTGLELIGQTIKKYNAALNSAKTGNDDLAIIQLKKVVTLNPKFVRAQQLLALLYIKTKEYQKAHKCLRQARTIDYSNTTTLRYMMEVGEFVRPVEKQKKQPAAAEKPTKNSLENVTPVGSYQEEKRLWVPFVNVMIGIVMGVLVTLFLIRPTLESRMDHTAGDADMIQKELTQRETELADANKKVSDLEADIKQMNKDAEKSSEDEEVLTAYEQLLKGVGLYIDNKLVEATTCVIGYKASDFKNKDAKSLYKLISKDLTEEDIQAIFESGNTKYNQRDYEGALKDFEAALSADPLNQDVLYFMGRTYHQQNKKKLAKYYYGKVLAVDDTTSRAAEAKSRLRELGVSEDQIADYADDDPNATMKPSASPKASDTPEPTD